MMFRFDGDKNLGVVSARGTRRVECGVTVLPGAAEGFEDGG